MINFCKNKHFQFVEVFQKIEITDGDHLKKILLKNDTLEIYFDNYY